MGYGSVRAMHNPAACQQCQGRGYRSDDRRAGEATQTVEVGKVIAYDRSQGMAQVYLEETLQRGDRLMAICHGMPVDFEVEAMIVAGMNLPMALRGWEVSMMVPQALQPGVWIIRRSSI